MGYQGAAAQVSRLSSEPGRGSSPGGGHSAAGASASVAFASTVAFAKDISGIAAGTLNGSAPAGSAGSAIVIALERLATTAVTLGRGRGRPVSRRPAAAAAAPSLGRTRPVRDVAATVASTEGWDWGACGADTARPARAAAAATESGGSGGGDGDRGQQRRGGDCALDGVGGGAGRQEQQGGARGAGLRILHHGRPVVVGGRSLAEKCSAWLKTNSVFWAPLNFSFDSSLVESGRRPFRGVAARPSGRGTGRHGAHWTEENWGCRPRGRIPPPAPQLATATAGNAATQ